MPSTGRSEPTGHRARHQSVIALWTTSYQVGGGALHQRSATCALGTKRTCPIHGTATQYWAASRARTPAQHVNNALNSVISTIPSACVSRGQQAMTERRATTAGQSLPQLTDPVGPPCVQCMNLLSALPTAHADAAWEAQQGAEPDPTLRQRLTHQTTFPPSPFPCGRRPGR